MFGFQQHFLYPWVSPAGRPGRIKSPSKSKLNKSLAETRAPMPPDLSVPVRTAAPKDLEIRPKQAKAWLEALPLAQSIEAAKMIRVNLVALSRAKVDVDDRLALLDAYRP